MNLPSLIAVPITFALLVTVLRIMGRPWRCPCKGGQVFSPGEEHYSMHLFDAWSVSHFGHGMFFYAAFRGFLVERSWFLSVALAVAFEAVWEVIENTPYVIGVYRRSGDRLYRGDSVINSVGDVLACLAGALTVGMFV